MAEETLRYGEITPTYMDLFPYWDYKIDELTLRQFGAPSASLTYTEETPPPYITKLVPQPVGRYWIHKHIGFISLINPSPMKSVKFQRLLGILIDNHGQAHVFINEHGKVNYTNTINNNRYPLSENLIDLIKSKRENYSGFDFKPHKKELNILCYDPPGTVNPVDREGRPLFLHGFYTVKKDDLTCEKLYNCISYLEPLESYHGMYSLLVKTGLLSTKPQPVEDEDLETAIAESLKPQKAYKISEVSKADMASAFVSFLDSYKPKQTPDTFFDTVLLN